MSMNGRHVQRTDLRMPEYAVASQVRPWHGTWLLFFGNLIEVNELQAVYRNLTDGTSELVFNVLWSYVKENVLQLLLILNVFLFLIHSLTKL
jgi:hypothetical protein